MNITADELLARFKRDYPQQFELSQLRLIIDKQNDEITRLRAELDARDSDTGTGAHAAADDGESDTGEEYAYVEAEGPTADAVSGTPVSMQLRRYNGFGE